MGKILSNNARLFLPVFSAGFFLFASIFLASAPLPAYAKNTFNPNPPTFQVSGWLPYWRAATSSADVLQHLNKLTQINPFGYSVKNDGTLADTANLDSATSSYAAVIKAARAQGVQVIPTIMWSNTGAIDTVLSSTTLRTQNVNSIVAEVRKNNWDGVDIDYEGKKASDINYFSAFLQQLNIALKQMGSKSLMCTIEARTPPQDLNTNTPISQFQYANDLTSIGKYCDQVRIMTYDQESADKTLNEAAGNAVYTPVSDPKWDTAVIQLMEKSIPASKMELGVATYGYEYSVTPYANNSGYIYDLLWAFNPGYATQIEQQYNVKPTRDSAGELQLEYVPTTTPTTLPSGTVPATPTNPSTLTASAGTPVAQASTNIPLQGTFRYLTWSDSVAIAQKVALAKSLGLAGIAIFKLDGGEDPGMWSVLPTK
jgi:spore germination protein YaaH